MVAIYPQPDDYEKAIQLIAPGELPLDRMITSVQPLSAVQRVFETLEANPAGMKTPPA